MTTDYVTLTDISGRDIYPVTDLAAINMTVTNGIAVVQTSGGTIGIRDGYIESSYFTNMTSQGIGAATIGETYIDGGTMFQLIGGYEVTDEIPPITGASHEKVPSEYSVRSAIDALATVGPSMAPGAGIVIETVPGTSGGTIAVAPGNGINVNTAQTGGVSVKAKTSGGLSVTSDGVAVNVGNGLGIDGNNAVRVAAKTSGGLAVDNNGVGIVAGDTLDLTGGTVNVKVADVDEVLTSLVTGSTIQDDVEEVTPGNLRGALSVGQAVDVSCPVALGNGPTSYIVNGTSYASYLAIQSADVYLGEYTVVAANKAANNRSYIGWLNNATHCFQKGASGLKYLFIADVRNDGDATKVNFASNNMVAGMSALSLPAYDEQNPPPFNRIWITTLCPADNKMGCNIGFTAVNNNSTLKLTVRNFRTYEVTTLTDEAIAYLAQYGALPANNPTGPDPLFRSNTIFQVRDKYLVKQDMVCPWIYTIGMPDNSDLTVGAGLSYKINYTDTPATPHKITVDTIPADAYGWDAHIQMFIKGTAAIQFQHPLILMDALTPNAGHNLIVKFRNGDALVYVDDTNAGNIVIATSGTTAGTLNYFLQQNPGTGYDNYIIFAAATDGATCDASNVGVNYNANVIGNGTDKTTITGTYNVASGKTLTLQNLGINSSTINGVGNTVLTATNIINVLNVVPGSTATFAGANSLDGTIRGAGTVTLADGSTVTGGTITDVTIYDSTAAPSTNNYTLDNVLLTGCTCSGNGGTVAGFFNTDLTGSTITSNTKGASFSYSFRYADGKAHTIQNSLIDQSLGYSVIITSGMLTITGSTLGRVYYMGTASTTCTITYGDATTIAGNFAGDSSRVCTVRLLSGSTITSTSGIGVRGSTTATSGIVSVGSYVDGVWVQADTSAGSATVIVGGHTYHVYGSGTKITDTGTDLPTV